MIFHLVYVDHVAHKQGIFHPEYRSEVAEADLLVGELAKRIAPTDTLVVFGDHGHTDTGRHALGLDVPTYISLRGPGFRRGLVLDQIHITTYRYLFSWALKLPLAADYSRERHPEALVSAPGARLPSAYSQPPVATAKPPTAGGAGTIGLYCLMALLVGLAFGLWWLVGDVIATGSATFKPRRIVRILVFTAVAALPVFAVGVALALLRSYVHEPFFPTISRIWAVVLIVTLVASRRFDLGWLALTVLGVPFLLLYPTTYRYGAPSVFAPAWLCWAATAYCLSYGFRDGLAEVRYVALGRWRVRRSTLLFAALVFFVQPFFFTDAVNFEFERFKALSPELAPTALWAQALAGAFGAWIIFYRRAEGLANRLVATSFVLGFLAVFFHIVPEGSLGEFFVGAGLLFGAVAVHRRARLGFLHAEAKGLARSLFLAALFVCYFYFVRVSSELRLDAVMLFAALRLSVLLLDHVPVARRNLKSNGVFLLVIGLIVSGWVSLSWGLTHLEWHAAYDFFPPKVVEEFVGLFLPLIVLKYALPVLIAKSLVLEGVRLEEIYPARQMALAIGVKFGTLILLVLGLGYYTPGSNVYLEATGELAIFLSLAAGML